MNDGEYITKDGKREITLKEYLRRTDESMVKQFMGWLLITFFVFSMFYII